jgi:sec-independent protein translocase protein TatC
MTKNPNGLSFFEHADEFRRRLIVCVIAFLVAACLFYSFIDPVLKFIIEPVGRLIFTSPGEAFTARITLALAGGFLLAFPVILYQVWRFVGAGLYERERRWILLFGPFSLICFFCGVIFGYTVMVPISLTFLLSFSSEWMVPMITVNQYISFVGSFVLAFGIIFELPLILMFLTKIGIATPAFLIQKRRHAIVLILIVSAFLTPPDVLTQCLMAIPLIVLYEAGIIVSQLTYRSKDQHAD